jgi:hypothetical protein
MFDSVPRGGRLPENFSFTLKRALLVTLASWDGDQRPSKYLQRIVWTSIPFPSMFAFHHQESITKILL